MDATTITVSVLVVLLIVAIAALLMKINEDTKRMDALRRMKNPPVERPAVMPRRLPRDPRDRRMDGSYAGEPSTSELAAVKAMAAMRKAKAEAAAKAAAEAAAEAAVIYTNPSRKVKLSAQEYFAKAQAAEREASGSDFIDNEERMYRPPLQSAQEYFAKAAAEAAAEAQADDIENVGDQSLMLDEDPSQEYDEMAEETGIVKIAIPQPDENWIKSRQVQPVKDLSVGIAITNDVSKHDNLQTGKITSKFPISIRPASFQHRQRPAVMPPMLSHKGPQMMRPAVMPYMPHHKGPQGKPAWSATPPGTGSAYFELMREAAAKAAQERDAKARYMVDKRARSMAENAEMQALKRIDNSGMKQYDMKKGPPQAMFGIDMGMKKTMKAEAEQAEMMAMKAAYEDGYKGLARAGIDYPISPGYPSSRDRLPAMVDRLPAMVDTSAAQAAKMEAEEAANKAAMKVEGYEMMEPRGYAIRV